MHRKIETRGAVAAATVPDFRMVAEVDVAVQILQSLHEIGLAELLARRRTVGQLVVRIQASVLAQFLTQMFEKDLFLHVLVVGVAFFGAFALGFVQNNLANMRAAGSDEKLILAPAIKYSLEQYMEFIAKDEYLEITPQSLRVRKIILDEIERKRAEKRNTDN